MARMTSQTTSNQSGEPRERAMVAGVRKIPTPITSPITSAVTEASPSWRERLGTVRRGRSLFRENPTLIRQDLLLVLQHRLEVPQNLALVVEYAHEANLILEDFFFVGDDLLLFLACRSCHGQLLVVVSNPPIGYTSP